jgi:hypothetical protein
MAFGVGVEKVVGAGIVLVHASLDQAHPEHARVEIQVLLGRPGNGRDMMKSLNVFHGFSFWAKIGFSQFREIPL